MNFHDLEPGDLVWCCATPSVRVPVYNPEHGWLGSVSLKTNDALIYIRRKTYKHFGSVFLFQFGEDILALTDTDRYYFNKAILANSVVTIHTIDAI